MWCIQHSICLTVIGQLTYDIVAPFKVRSYIWSFSAPKLLWLPLIFDEFHIPVPKLSILIKQVPSQSYTGSKGFAASTSIEVTAHTSQQLRADLLVYILLRMSLIVSSHTSSSTRNCSNCLCSFVQQ